VEKKLIADMRKEQERVELHRMIWNAATEFVHTGGFGEGFRMIFEEYL